MFAEWFALVIVHCSLERFAATVASETTRVPHLADSRNTIVLHNLLAARANLTEQFVVVELTVRLILVFEVFALDESLTANSALKTLWMTCTRKCSKGTADDGLAATSAHVLDELLIAIIAVVLAIVLLAVTTHEIATT